MKLRTLRAEKKRPNKRKINMKGGTDMYCDKCQKEIMGDFSNKDMKNYCNYCGNELNSGTATKKTKKGKKESKPSISQNYDVAETQASDTSLNSLSDKENDEKDFLEKFGLIKGSNKRRIFIIFVLLSAFALLILILTPFVYNFIHAFFYLLLIVLLFWAYEDRFDGSLMPIFLIIVMISINFYGNSLNKQDVKIGEIKDDQETSSAAVQQSKVEKKETNQQTMAKISANDAMGIYRSEIVLPNGVVFSDKNFGCIVTKHSEEDGATNYKDGYRTEFTVERTDGKEMTEEEIQNTAYSVYEYLFNLRDKVEYQTTYVAIHFMSPRSNIYLGDEKLEVYFLTDSEGKITVSGVDGSVINKDHNSVSLFQFIGKNFKEPEDTSVMSEAMCWTTLPVKSYISKETIDSESDTKNPIANDNEPDWTVAGGNIFNGVTLYYGTENEKICVGQVVETNDNCTDNAGNSFRGVLIKMDSGSLEWKDRDAILRGPWYIKSNDPYLLN